MNATKRPKKTNGESVRGFATVTGTGRNEITLFSRTMIGLESGFNHFNDGRTPFSKSEVSRVRIYSEPEWK